MLFDAIERDGLVRPALPNAKWRTRSANWRRGNSASRSIGTSASCGQGPMASPLPATIHRSALSSADDIVYVDLGPVFEAWEADIGKSYALGTDPQQAQAGRRPAARFSTRCRRIIKRNPNMTGAALYAFATRSRRGGRLALRRQDRRPSGQRIRPRPDPRRQGAVSHQPAEPDADERSGRQGPHPALDIGNPSGGARRQLSAAFTRGCCDFDLHRGGSGARRFAAADPGRLFADPGIHLAQWPAPGCGRHRAGRRDAGGGNQGGAGRSARRRQMAGISGLLRPVLFRHSAGFPARACPARRPA